MRWTCDFCLSQRNNWPSRVVRFVVVRVHMAYYPFWILVWSSTHGNATTLNLLHFMFRFLRPLSVCATHEFARISFSGFFCLIWSQCAWTLCVRLMYNVVWHKSSGGRVPKIRINKSSFTLISLKWPNEFVTCDFDQFENGESCVRNHNEREKWRAWQAHELELFKFIESNLSAAGETATNGLVLKNEIFSVWIGHNCHMCREGGIVEAIEIIELTHHLMVNALNW